MSESHPDGGAWPRAVSNDEAAAFARALTSAGFHVHTRPGDQTIEVPVFGADVHIALSATGLALVPGRFTPAVALNDARPGGMPPPPPRTPLTGAEAAVIAVLVVAVILLLGVLVWRLT